MDLGNINDDLLSSYKVINHILHKEYKNHFEREIGITLNIKKEDITPINLFRTLQNKCSFLINDMGMEGW